MGGWVEQQSLVLAGGASSSKRPPPQGAWEEHRQRDESVLGYGCLYAHDVPYFHRPR